MVTERLRTGTIFILITILTGGNAFGLTLLSGDETPSAPGFALATDVERPTPSAEEKKTYAVESVFSVDFPKLLATDTGHILTSPMGWDKKDWLTLSVAAAVVAAAGLLDKPVRTQALHIQSAAGSDAASRIRQFGENYSFAALGLFFAGGEAFQDPTAKAVFIDGAAATLVASGIITPTLKWAVGRYRPSEEMGSLAFHPFSGSASFPSGEATQAFAVASVIASHYDDLWIKVSSYGIASLVGVARLYEDAHWTSDVVAGALIGTAVGTAIVHFNDKRRTNKEKETTFIIAPLLSRNGGGVTIGLIR